MIKIRIVPLLALFIVLCLAGVVHAKLPEAYEVIFLYGPSGSAGSSPKAINNKSEVVGSYYTTGGTSKPAYWGPDQTFRDIGTFGGSSGSAQGINDGSYVVGNAQNSETHFRAFLWDPTTGVKRDLGDLGGTLNDAGASGINIHGRAAGYAWSPAYFALPIACLFELNKPPVNLSDLTTQSNALGINDSGLVAGQRDGRAVIWDQGVMQDLGPGGEARGVNNSGEVVGYYTGPSSYPRGFIWDKLKGLRELPTLGGNTGNALGINSQGQVVGLATTSIKTSHAFIWEADRGTIDLNGLANIPGGMALIAANGINDKGEVAATAGQLSGPDTYACLLRPTKRQQELPAIENLLLN